MLISHEMSWADELWAMAEPHAAKNERTSPIFSSKAALVDNYMRLELPVIEVGVACNITKVQSYLALCASG